MFYENEFDKIWENIVFPQIDEFSKKLGLKHKNSKWLKFLLKYKYNKYKDEIVKNFMVQDTRRIDRHKIAACFTKAIIVVKPVYVSFGKKIELIFSSKKKKLMDILSWDETLISADETIPIENLYSFFNEYLAMSVALSILNSYIKSDERPGRFKHKMVFPQPFPAEDEDYLLDVCIALSNTKNRYLNPITYANVFFLWEKYSCRKQQCDNLSDAYREVLRKKGYKEQDIETELLYALTTQKPSF